jgi:hypothetical protein
VSEVMFGVAGVVRHRAIARAMTDGARASTPTRADWLAAARAIAALGGGKVTTSRLFWNDTLIAAQCARLGLALATNNPADYRRLQAHLAFAVVPPSAREPRSVGPPLPCGRHRQVRRTHYPKIGPRRTMGRRIVALARGSTAHGWVSSAGVLPLRPIPPVPMVRIELYYVTCRSAMTCNRANHGAYTAAPARESETHRRNTPEVHRPDTPGHC